MPILWKKEFELGILSIDEQHKKLIGIINTLSKNISEGLSKGDINSAIIRMELYVQDHFMYEEQYFTAMGYVDAPEHIEEHRLFLKKTEDFRERAQIEESTLSVEILGYLEEWFLHHVQVVDRKYVESFQSYGVK